MLKLSASLSFKNNRRYSKKCTKKQVRTAQKMKFSIKDFFSNCDQIRRKLQTWSHLLKKSLMHRSQKYDINRPRPGHKYIKYMCLSIMIVICVKQELSNIQSGIYEKGNQH